MFSKTFSPRFVTIIIVIIFFLLGYLFGLFSGLGRSQHNEVIELHVKNTFSKDVVLFMTAHQEKRPSTVWSLKLFKDGLLKSRGETGVGLVFGSYFQDDNVIIDSIEISRVQSMLSEIEDYRYPVTHISTNDYVIMVSYRISTSLEQDRFRSFSCMQSSCQKAVCELFDVLNLHFEKEMKISNQICNNGFIQFK